MDHQELLNRLLRQGRVKLVRNQRGVELSLNATVRLSLQEALDTEVMIAGVGVKVPPLGIQLKEEWRPIPLKRYRGLYEASNLGRIRKMISDRAWPKGHVLSPRPTTKGYLVVQVGTCEGRRYAPFVHALVTAAFLGERPSDLQVNHKNGIKSDNRITNLEYATAKENALHSRRVLGNGRGERQARAVLTEKLVREIRRRYKPGMNKSAMAREYGIANGTLNAVLSRRTWMHVK